MVNAGANNPSTAQFRFWEISNVNLAFLRAQRRVLWIFITSFRNILVYDAWRAMTGNRFLFVFFSAKHDTDSRVLIIAIIKFYCATGLLKIIRLTLILHAAY